MNTYMLNHDRGIDPNNPMSFLTSVVPGNLAATTPKSLTGTTSRSMISRSGRREGTLQRRAAGATIFPGNATFGS